MLELTLTKKANVLLNKLKLEKIRDGLCIQIMHLGSFNDEPKSFEKMEDYAVEQGRQRLSKMHREMYLSDFRKVPTEKLKTILRFQIN